MVALAWFIQSASAAKTCKAPGGLHQYVLHGEPCTYKNRARFEELGCNIPGSPVNEDISQYSEIHWSTATSRMRIQGDHLSDSFDDAICQDAAIVSVAPMCTLHPKPLNQIFSFVAHCSSILPTIAREQLLLSFPTLTTTYSAFPESISFRSSC